MDHLWSQIYYGLNVARSYYQLPYFNLFKKINNAFKLNQKKMVIPQNTNANVNFLYVLNHIAEKTNYCHKKTKWKIEPRICCECITWSDAFLNRLYFSHFLWKSKITQVLLRAAAKLNVKIKNRALIKKNIWILFNFKNIKKKSRLVVFFRSQNEYTKSIGSFIHKKETFFSKKKKLLFFDKCFLFL